MSTKTYNISETMQDHRTKDTMTN